MSEIVLFRTHYLDDGLIEFATKLAETRQVGFVVDEKIGKETIDGFRTAVLNKSSIESDGIYFGSDHAWRCGDYSLIVGQKYFPDFDYYWLLDPDVWLTFSEPGVFFDFFQNIDIDFLATHFGESSKSWLWHSSMEGRAEKIMQCFFPIVRMSARALEIVAAGRRALTFEREAGRFVGEWPNDEVFCSTEITRAGLMSGDINSCGVEFYDHRTFNSGRPISRLAVRASGVRDRLWHPVLSGTQFENRARRFIHPLTDPATTSDTLADLAQEVGADRAKAIATELLGPCVPPMRTE